MTAPTISGQITAAGLIKSGPGMLYLTGNNSSTLVGNIVINQGSIALWSGQVDYNGPKVNGNPTSIIATAGPSADSVLGAITNNIILNGGELNAAGVNGTTVDINHIIKVGPAGGTIQGSYFGSFIIHNGFQDLAPTNPGTLYLGDNTPIMFGHSTFSGTAVLTGGTWRLQDAAEGGLPGDNGLLTTGPVVIESLGGLSIFRQTVEDMRTSALTLLGQGGGSNGTFTMSTAGAAHRFAPGFRHRDLGRFLVLGVAGHDVVCRL